MTSTNSTPSITPFREAMGLTGRWLMISLAIITFIYFLFVYTAFGSLISWLAPYGDKTAWYLTRSSGVVAYLLLTGSTVWGILLSTKYVKDHIPAPIAMNMHNELSWFSVISASVHAFLLVFDTYYTYEWSDLLIPFTGPYRPVEVGWGIIGLYLLFLVNISFHWRKVIGQKNWRKLHYLTFAVYILVTWHGWAAGTDSNLTGMKVLYYGSGFLVLFLTNYRGLVALIKTVSA